MAYKLRATSTFSGTEGFIKSGNVFEVENEDRANKLVKDLKLAEYADGDAENSEIKALDDYTKAELQDQAEKAGVEGYKGMNKDELVTAIQEKDPNYNGGADAESVDNGGNGAQ